MEQSQTRHNATMMNFGIRNLDFLRFIITSKRLFEKSKIQNFRGLASFVMALERAKTENLGITTQNTVQNFEFLSFLKGKLHVDCWNMQTSQSFSSNL